MWLVPEGEGLPWHGPAVTSPFPTPHHTPIEHILLPLYHFNIIILRLALQKIKNKRNTHTHTHSGWWWTPLISELEARLYILSSRAIQKNHVRRKRQDR